MTIEEKITEIEAAIKAEWKSLQQHLQTRIETDPDGYVVDVMQGAEKTEIGSVIVELQDALRSLSTDPDAALRLIRLLEDAETTSRMAAYIHGRTAGARETARLLLGRDVAAA